MKQRIRIDKAVPNTGALDFSWLLDAPAGKHGFVTAKDGHLYFADGTRAKFIGFNMPTRSNTPDHETADKLAKRLASLGVNVVRLHAADAPIGPSGWSSSEHNPLINYKSGGSRDFHPLGLDRFDYFFAKLKEQGIYLHIDLLVNRAFMNADGLDYPDMPSFHVKCFTHFNRRLIELQKEYADKLLTHINPYTGLAYIDDPAVMTIEINNEDSVFVGTADIKDVPGVEAYRNELQRRFNSFLLAKYDTRQNMAEAWTHNEVCALGDGEDPLRGTVLFPEGFNFQLVNDPDGRWDGPESPARYAEFMEFGIYINRAYYQEMIDFVRSLGSKVPIATSNLLNGAADVYSHIDGDVMENNAYFNHPMPPFGTPVKVPGIREYVTSNPLTMHNDGIFMRADLVTMAGTAAVKGKPFILSEWNEYGLHPFHSTAFISLTAYACLNDWDGLIVYCYHTSERFDDQPADAILDIFDAYNDPALICQFGFMAAMFLKGLVSPAKTNVDLVFTKNDLLTLPPWFRMPYTYLSYVTNLRNVFLDSGSNYQGKADVALTAGHVSGGNLSEASHAVYYAWSGYRDALRKASGEGWLENITATGSDEQRLVFPDIKKTAGSGDYTKFAEELDTALKHWGVLSETSGFVNGSLVSDTGEINFDPINAKFSVNTANCAYFSGNPKDGVSLTEGVSIELNNERISAALLPLNGGENKLLTLLGTTGMDETEFINEGFITTVDMKGKLFAETAEGRLIINGANATLTALDPSGTAIEEIPGKTVDDKTIFELTGLIPAVNFLLAQF
jgi:hypothetical protein